MNLSVTNYQDCGMPNGFAWSADMYFNGEKVGVVSQSGDGSANHYYFDKPTDREQFSVVFGKDEFDQSDVIESALQKAGF